MHVSSSLFIAKAVWLPRLWLTVSCFPSCSITSPLTPTCGSSALWQEGLPCGGGKLKHSWLVKRAEMCLVKERRVFVIVKKKTGAHTAVCVECRRYFNTYIYKLLNSLSCNCTLQISIHHHINTQVRAVLKVQHSRIWPRGEYGNKQR